MHEVVCSLLLDTPNDNRSIIFATQTGQKRFVCCETQRLDSHLVQLMACDLFLCLPRPNDHECTQAHVVDLTGCNEATAAEIKKNYSTIIT